MPMNEYFHGTNGDNLKQIIQNKKMIPDQDGNIFVSDASDVFQHGGTERAGWLWLRGLVLISKKG